MARYRDIDMSARLLPVSLEAQIVPGSFAHAVYHLVGELDLSGFDAHYRNDETGAPAHGPAMLLRAVLLAYFAIDGVKLPSNASKHRSGTRTDFLARAEKLERAAAQMLDQHRANDARAEGPTESARIAARMQRMTREARQIRDWLVAHPTDRTGPNGGLRKSNRTDNESAKLATDKGVIQGYCGVAVVDDLHQVIIEAQAHGTGAEQDLLLPVIDACAPLAAGHTRYTADAGYHSEANLEGLTERGIDALIADGQMRQRDERFADQGKHTAKPEPLHDKGAKKKRPALFTPSDFRIAEDHSHATCPAGKRLYRNGRDCTIRGYRAIKFRAPISTCADCPLRSRCLRKPDTTPARQVALLIRKSEATHTQRMRERIDSPQGRRLYARRFATVEPVFGNLRHNKRLNRFTLRGRTKVDGQWKLFALVHNIEKLVNHRKTG